MTKTATADPDKKQAEIDKLCAEAEAARSTAALNAVTARKIGAEADLAEASAKVAGLELAKFLEGEQVRVNSDSHHRIHQFDGGVTDATVAKCMAQLRTWDRIDPDCDIEIIFNSPGGSITPGMALFDLIFRLSKRGGGTHKVTVGAQGYAASMGGILLQAADVRWIGAQSFLMIHEMSSQTGGKIGEMKDDVKFYDAICARVVDIFVDRAGGKITKDKFIESWTRIDWWMLSDEALALGFVDEIR